MTRPVRLLPVLLGAALLVGCTSSPSPDERAGTIRPDLPEIGEWTWTEKGGSVGLNDPVIFVEPAREFPYRMYVHAEGGQDLYRSKDAATWEKVANDVIPSGGGTNFNWGRKGPDGRYYLYRTVQDSVTELWTGSELTDLENEGTVLEEPDTGGYYNPDTDTWHMYYETYPAEGSPCGRGLGHAVSEDGMQWEKRGVALDLRDKTWKTGDPDVVRVGDTYHMFIDYTAPDHPRYKIAVATSSDLSSFSLREDPPTTDWLGGDACVRYVPEQERFVMYQEFHGEDTHGVGWGVSQQVPQ
ncbi:MAG: hypothetical protein V5A22_12310 [Salinivenus sp.]